MTPADDLDAKTGGSAADDEVDPWDEDLWDDEPSIDGRTQLMLQLALVGVIVAIIAAVVVIKSGDDDGTSTRSATSQPATNDGVTTTVAPAVDGGTQASGPGWPTEVNGRPKAFGELGGTPEEAPGGAEPGVYLWNDFDGWHLWVVNGGDVSGVQGKIASNDAIAGAEVVPAGAGTADPVDVVIEYDLSSEPEIAGIDFNPGFYANSLVVTVDGPDGPLPANLVHLGQNLAPAENPAVIVQVQGP